MACPHGPAVEDSLGVIAEEVTFEKGKVNVAAPLLSRRNSVACCSEVTENLKGKKAAAILRVPWKYAATEKEFISLMERVQEECAPPITSNRPSRKSLPAGALRSYMRSTVSSVRRSQGGLAPQSPQDDSAKSESNLKRDSQGSNRQSSLQRKKIVPVKPSIPPVLLKDRGTGGGGGAAAVGPEAKPPLTPSANKESVRQQLPEDTACLPDEKKEGVVKRFGGRATGPCESNCTGCQLVDLWFIFWHAQFNPPSVHKAEKNKASSSATHQ